MAVYFSTKIIWNRSAFFDRKVCNAFVGIELIRAQQRVGRAGLDAARAGAAAIWGGGVWRKFKGGKDHAEKKPRALFLIDDAGVLSHPSDSCVLGKDSLHDRSSINVTAGDQSRLRFRGNGLA